MKPDIRQLARDGVAAAREGDSARARILFEAIIEQDENNEMGWFGLSTVVEDDAARIEALQRVIAINPKNDRAQEMLADVMAQQAEAMQVKEEAASGEAWGDFGEDVEAGEIDETGEVDEKPAKPRRSFNMDKDIFPGVTRRMLALGLSVILVLVACNAAGIMMVLRNQNIADQNEQATAAALQSTQRAQQAQQTEVAANATGTAIAAASTPTPFSPTLPPTWTPELIPTEDVSLIPTALPMAIGSEMFSGELLLAQGADRLDNGYVSIVRLPLDGRPPFTLYDGSAANPRISPLGEYLTYTRYSSATREQAVEFAWTDTSEPSEFLTTLLGGIVLQGQDDANFSPDNVWMTFVGREPGNTNTDVYVVAVQDLLNQAAIQGGDVQTVPSLSKLTDGTANNYAPSWADSTRMVIVEDSSGRGGGVDLKLLGTNLQISNLTTNLNLMIEDNPEMAPDGQRIAFQAHPQGDPENNDIYIMAVVEGGQPLLIVDSAGDDVRPRWSPDGRFLAYSSNVAGGSYEVYIVDVSTYVRYQVTDNGMYNIANQWLSLP